jgi:hypothetical protein
MAATPDVVLLTAVAVHAGFQVTVTALVYPALFRAPDWDRAHAAHSRAITLIVGVVYAALVAAAAWVLLDGVTGPSTVVALAGVALSLAATALVAAPLHSRLSRGRDARLLRRLRIADSARTVGALVALLGAALAAL